MRINLNKKNILLAILFCILYLLMYKSFLHANAAYAGFVYYKKNFFFIVLSVVITTVPIFFYKSQSTAVSNLFSIFIYILLYVPTVLTFCVGSQESLGLITLIQMIFCCAMCMFFSVNNLIFRGWKVPRKGIDASVILIITVVSSLYFIYLFGERLLFVSFDDVYTHRAENNNIAVGFNGYLFSWLTSCFAPVCLIEGITKKRRLYTIVGIAACIIIYMGTAAKGALLTPVFIYGIYFILRKSALNKLYEGIIIALSFLMLLLITIKPTMNDNPILYSAGSIAMWRTLANGGLLNLWYYNFFSTHPHTHYTHLSPVNYFTQSYPYGDKGLGQVIGQHYWSEDANTNANFWATDGIAAEGLAGIIIISVIMYLFLIVLNTITHQHHNKIFTYLLFISVIMSLTNVSIFSTLWGNGGLFVILYAIFHKNTMPSKSG